MSGILLYYDENQKLTIISGIMEITDDFALVEWKR